MDSAVILIPVSVEHFQSLIRAEILKALKEAGAVNPQQDEFLSRADVKTLFHLSFVTLHKLKKSGVLPYYKINRRILFKKSELLEFISRRKRKNINPFPDSDATA